MKADKMFKELGYEKQDESIFGLVYRNKNNYAEITFDIYDETICAGINDDESDIFEYGRVASNKPKM